MSVSTKSDFRDCMVISQPAPKPGWIESNVPTDMIQTILGFSTNNAMQKACLVNRRWNKATISAAESGEFSKVKSFTEFLAANLGEEVSPTEREELHKTGSYKETFGFPSLLTLKAYIYEQKEKISAILKKKKLLTLLKLDLAWARGGRPTFFEDIFFLAWIESQLDRAEKKNDGNNEKSSLLKDVCTDLVLSGRADKGIEIAHRITDSVQKSEALLWLVKSFAQNSQFVKALEIAVSMPEGQQKKMAFLTIRLELEDRGWRDLDQALAILQTIPQGDIQRLDTRLGMLRTALRHGLLEKVYEIADTMPDDSRTFSLLAEMAVALVETGACVAAIELVNSIPDLNTRNQALLEMAVALVGKGACGAATKLVNSIPDLNMRNQALFKMAVALVNGSDFDSRWVQSVLRVKLEDAAYIGYSIGSFKSCRGEDALKIVEHISDQKVKDAAWLVMAKGLAKAENADTIVAFATKISNAVIRNSFFKFAAEMLVKSCKIDDAAAIANKLYEASRSECVLLTIAKGLVIRGALLPAITVADRLSEESLDDTIEFSLHSDFSDIDAYSLDIDGIDEALGRANTLSKERLKRPILMAICETLVKRGALNKALEIFTKIPEGAQKNSTLFRMCHWLVMRGEFDEVEHIISLLPDDCNGLSVFSTKLYALVHLCRTLARENRLSRALAIAYELADNKQKDTVHCAISFALLHSGKFAEALSVLDMILDQKERESVLKGLAEAFVSRGSYDNAILVARLIEDSRQRDEAFQSIWNLRKKTER